MSKQFFLTAVIALLFVVRTFGQKIELPTLIPKPLTAEQRVTMNEGIKLHDNRRYDEAIAVYKKVLAENPDSPEVLYETAYSYFAKNDFQNSIEYSLKAARYKSDFLPIIYVMLGNVLDDSKQPQKAIEVYNLGLKINPENYLLHFNLGVTHRRLGKWQEARESFKKSAALNSAHGSSQLFLADTYYENKYRVPALLAATRFLILEPNTERTERATKIIGEVLRGGASKGNKPNQIDIFVSTDSPKDEGDFTSVETFLGLSSALQLSKDNKKTSAQIIESQYASIIETLSSAEDKNKTKFIWKYYLPYFREMSKRGYLETLANIVSLKTGDESARQWLKNNEAKLVEFIQWSEKYPFPKNLI
jgi:tetratricopeptide (TPR) repeat protein